LAEAAEPFLLQNVYLSDVGTNIPVTQVSQIKVDTSSVKDLASILPEKPKEITKEMRVGKIPERCARPPKDDDVIDMVFVHGYCAQQNPWQKSGNFPVDADYFLKPGANMNNDEFAQAIATFADPLDAYSLIGHSQGGMASAHLLNYYFSGADANTAPHTIQSVGTPYQGNSGAGGGADLIKTFGIGCGANAALTKDGAALWLSGITTESRKEIYYYTTQYTPGLFRYCQAGVGLVLSAPNDGTAELTLAQLPGANNMGNTQGQCHTENMNFPPQCYDSSRNTLILENGEPEALRKRRLAL
jgi:pimeloyl-ACP methyl ester carboxylesterase